MRTAIEDPDDDRPVEATGESFTHVRGRQYELDGEPTDGDVPDEPPARRTRLPRAAPVRHQLDAQAVTENGEPQVGDIGCVNIAGNVGCSSA